MKYSCSICGTYFEPDSKKFICPICGNTDENYLLKSIEIDDGEKDNMKEKIKCFLSRKCHSAAYIKLCSKKLEELGYFDLARELDVVAQKKLENEAILLELLGVKNDIRLNLNNVVTRAVEDLYLANEITALENKDDNEGIYSLLQQLKLEEEKNIFILNNIAKKCLYELRDSR